MKKISFRESMLTGIQDKIDLSMLVITIIATIIDLFGIYDLTGLIGIYIVYVLGVILRVGYLKNIIRIKMKEDN